MTLIETIIYVSLLGLFLSTLILTAYFLISEADYLQDQIVIDEEANFLAHKINYLLSIDRRSTSTIQSRVSEWVNSRVVISDLQFEEEENYISYSFKIDEENFENTVYFK